MSVLFGHACFSERADDAASCSPRRCADGGRRQPTSCDNWPNAWDRQQAEASQKAGSPTYAGANAGTGARAFCAVIDAVAVPIDLLICVKPAVRVIRH